MVHAYSWAGSRHSRATRIAALVAILAASLGGTASAEAGRPDPGASSVAQYVELVPTASGPSAPGIGKERQRRLSPQAERALGRAPDATAASLRAVATTSTYGAPPSPRRGSAAIRDGVTAPEAPSRNRSLEALPAAAAPTGDTRAIGLIAILTLVTVTAGTISLRRRT